MFTLRHLFATVASALLLSSSSVSADVDLTTQTISVIAYSAAHTPAATAFQPSPNSGTFISGDTDTLTFKIPADGSDSKYTLAIDDSGEFTITIPKGVTLNTFDGFELEFGPILTPDLTVSFDSVAIDSVVQVGNTIAGAELPTVSVGLDGKVQVDFDFSDAALQALTVDHSVTYNYKFKAVTSTGCTGGPGVCGDPQFTGFLGQSYQIHGVSNTVYNVLSTPDLQLNALFSYREAGKCRKGTMCFSHPGNYFGEIGMLLKNEDIVNRLRIVAGPVDAGMQVLLNDQALVSGQTLSIGESSLVFTNAFEMSIQTRDFSLRFSNSDMFLNQDISVNTPLLSKIQAYKQAVKRNDTSAVAEVSSSLPHGLLGQTWEHKTYQNRWKYIDGQLFDYVLADGLFSANFHFNRFEQ